MNVSKTNLNCKNLKVGIVTLPALSEFIGSKFIKGSSGCLKRTGLFRREITIAGYQLLMKFLSCTTKMANSGIMMRIFTVRCC